MKTILWAALLGSCVVVPGARAGAEPPRQEWLPPPRVVVSPYPPLATSSARYSPPTPYYPYPRVSRYEVWQNYGVDRSGRFRPLVIFSPYGSYYRDNHEPFPWISTHSWEFTPSVLGPPPPSGR